MKKYSWLILFTVILAVYLVGIEWPSMTIQYICKPLLMPVLAGWFLFSLNENKNDLKRWVILALLFSWAGDVLLLFQASDKLFFMLGLASFLLAHIFYIIFFHSIRVREGIKGNPWLLVIVVIYYGALIGLLSPYLADLTWPVRVYGIVISFMFMLAMHMLFIRDKKAGRLMMIGALLFVLSDSSLAINKFYQPFVGADIVIIVTYALAQCLIIKGAIDYMRPLRE